MKTLYQRTHAVRDTMVEATVDEDDLQSSLSMRIEYMNTTQYNIVLKMRDGSCFTVKPTLNNYNSARAGAVYVRKTYKFDGLRVNLNLQDLLNVEGEGFSADERRAICQAYDEAKMRAIRSRLNHEIIEFHIDHKIPYEDLLSDGLIYARRIDTLICLSGREADGHHPYSDRGYQARLFAEEEHLNYENQLQTSIFIVDSKNRFGYKYLNLNGEVYQIKIITDSEFEDGVYYYRAGQVVAGASAAPKMRRYEFDKAVEELSIYRSYTEAEAAGGLKEQIERKHEKEVQEIRENELRLKKEKAVIEQSKLQLEAERVTKDSLLAAYEKEIKQLTLQITEAKLRHEDENLLRDQKVKEIEHGRKIKAAELDIVVDSVKAQNSISTSNAKASAESAKAGNTATGEVVKFLGAITAAAVLGVGWYKRK